MHLKFLYGGMIYILVGMISPMGMFYIPTVAMCMPSGTICKPAGIIGNRIPVGDICL